MRRILFASLATLAVLLFWTAASTTVVLASPEKVLPDGSHQVTFSIPDMECSMCSRSVHTELKRVHGVREIKVDDANRVAVVRFDPAQVNVKKLQAAIKKAGFDCKQIDTP